MAGIVSLSVALLDNYVGKSIEDICPLKFGKVGDAHNHCAHFVSHVLKLNDSLHLGTTCAGMIWKGKEHADAAGCIRVNNIFNACDDLEEPDDDGCLVYYTTKSNMHKDGTMGDHKQKHVGICYKGRVYNYGNKKDEVRDDEVGDLAKLYGAKTITLYTAFPDGAKALTLEEIKALY